MRLPPVSYTFKEDFNMHGQNEKKPIRAVLAGAGNRGMIYAGYSLKHPEELRITAVVEPREIRRRHAAEMFSIPPERCYASIEEFPRSGREVADVAINGTMDELHIHTSLPLLEAGLDMLLEKPIGTSEEEVLALLKKAGETKRKVMICHVLRYAPFYAEVRKRIAEGEIGDIISIHTAENVTYHHIASAFIRGKWRSRESCNSTMLMQKCCHDLDLITWFKSGIAPKRTASFGGRMFFREERAPEGSGSRCLTDCKIEGTCPYSARHIYMTKNRWTQYAWESIEHLGGIHASEADKIHSLKTENPYGRCVWRCDNDVVDHQTVIIEFEDGSIASHDLNGNTVKGGRQVYIVGTKGEIEGRMEDGFFYIRRPDLAPGSYFTAEKVDVNTSGDMHGGGDLRLVADFLRLVRGEPASISTTTLEDSVYGHRIGFRADQAMEQHKTLEV